MIVDRKALVQRLFSALDEKDSASKLAIVFLAQYAAMFIILVFHNNVSSAQSLFLASFTVVTRELFLRKCFRALIRRQWLLDRTHLRLSVVCVNLTRMCSLMMLT